MLARRGFVSALVCAWIGLVGACGGGAGTLDGGHDAGDGSLSDAATAEVDAERAAEGGVDAGTRLEDGGPAGDCASASEVTLPCFARRFQEASCRQALRCYAPEAVDQRELTCHPGLEWYEGMEPWVDAGYLQFDPTAAAECIRQMGEDCATRIEACERAFVGLVPEGGACAGGRACVPGTYCARVIDVCPGACTAVASAGTPCDPWGYDTCAEGLFCDRTTSRCAETLAIGAACDRYEWRACGSGAECVLGICRGPLPSGEPCETSSNCEDGLFCSGTPRQCAIGGAAGAPCEVGAPCGPYLTCRRGICERAAAPGEPCTSEEECPVGYACPASSCEALPVIGEPCPAGDCALGSCLEGGCALSPDGEACEGPLGGYLRECEGLCSRGGECVPAAGVGESCGGGISCGYRLRCGAEATCVEYCSLPLP